MLPVLAGAALLVLALAGCASAGQSASAPPAPQPPAPAELDAADVETWLDGLLPAALARTGVPGATVAVVHDGGLLTARGYGHADTGVDGGEPAEVDPERTLFRAGSVSKLLTATAVMQLVERGELELDVDVAQYLDFEVPRTFDTDLTVRHLLSHTPGFDERVAGIIQPGQAAPIDLRAALATDPPKQVYEPGTVPAYSNYGSALAGYLVERVSGVPFEDYVQQQVLAPLGMSSSTFHQPLPEELRPRMANGYPTPGGPAEPFEAVGVPPAGSLTTTATDMAQFMLAQLDAGEAELLDEPTRRLMHAPALDEESLGELAQAPRMTLGFFDESRNGHRILGHGGDTRYFHSHLQVHLDSGAGVFISFNGEGESGVDTLWLREAVLTGFTDRYFPRSQPAAEPVPEQTMRDQAEQVAGAYVSARGFHKTFLAVLGPVDRTQVTALDDGRLRFEPGPHTPWPAEYEAISPTVWQEVNGESQLAVQYADGEVVAIGHDSALTLVPASPAQHVAVPVLAGSVLLLVATALAWPVGALVRRRRGTAPLPRRRRLVRTLSRAAVLSALLAFVGWGAVVVSVMDFQQVPGGLIRAVQAAQALGVAGLVPAVWRLVDEVRHRSGWRHTAASLLVCLALAGAAWFAVTFQLLGLHISY